MKNIDPGKADNEAARTAQRRTQVARVSAQDQLRWRQWMQSAAQTEAARRTALALGVTHLPKPSPFEQMRLVAQERRPGTRDAAASLLADLVAHEAAASADSAELHLAHADYKETQSHNDEATPIQRRQQGAGLRPHSQPGQATAMTSHGRGDGQPAEHTAEHTRPAIRPDPYQRPSPASLLSIGLAAPPTEGEQIAGAGTDNQQAPLDAAGDELAGSNAVSVAATVRAQMRVASARAELHETVQPGRDDVRYGERDDGRDRMQAPGPDGPAQSPGPTAQCAELVEQRRADHARNLLEQITLEDEVGLPDEESPDNKTTAQHQRLHDELRQIVGMGVQPAVQAQAQALLVRLERLRSPDAPTVDKAPAIGANRAASEPEDEDESSAALPHVLPPDPSARLDHIQSFIAAQERQIQAENTPPSLPLLTLRSI